MDNISRNSWKHRLLAFYETHETKLDLTFFLGGFLFDIVTLTDIDDPIGILQQVAYLLIIGSILYFDFVWRAVPNGSSFGPPRWMARAWAYRQLALHFFLGSLLSLYSLFFLKSSSFFSSFIFVAALMAIMVLNELKTVQGGGLSVKIALFVICVFCFYSLLFPVILGFVGIVPFALSLVATVGSIYFIYWRLTKRLTPPTLKREVLWPSLAVAGGFFLFYVMGWIPPVPLSAEKMGVYHGVEKEGADYVLLHEKPWWKFWRRGDQDFVAEPGDKIFFFVSVFSPARFDDQVMLHWMYKDPRRGWVTSDRIPMRVTGGRKGGYRGSTSKANYSPGDWRVSVETTDGREIGRMYFEVEKAEAKNPDRVFSKDRY